MEEIIRRDRALFFKELFSPGLVVVYLFGTLIELVWRRPIEAVVITWLIVMGFVSYRCIVKSKDKRFRMERFKLLWQACMDRHERFNKGLKALSKKGVADLQELPKTIDAVASDLYFALRRADLVATEVAQSEGWLIPQPRMGQAMSPDRQAQELYRIADKNIAEYRQHYVGVMSGVERTEAQAAVFTTTLDTLRMKMLGYRLVGKDTETPTQDFLAALTEARMQLESIDKALEELDLTPFPKTISIVPETLTSADDVELLVAMAESDSNPPPIPGELRERLQAQPPTEQEQEH